MKSLSIRTMLAIMLVMATTIRCTKDLEALNVDPTAAGPENFNPNFLLTTAQIRYTGSADFSYETWRAQLIFCSTMIQHFSTVATYWVGDKYLDNPSYAASYFERAFDEQVKHVVDLVELTKEKPEYANLHQIARIWKATIFHRITDLYGDVPYFEAGRGYYDRIFKPEYDPQQDIYMDLLKELSEATAALDASKDIPVGDLIYNGDIGKWKKFGYSMMLRLGMRLTKVNIAEAQKWAEAAAVGGVMSDITDNAFVLHDPSKGRPTINRISQVLNLSYELPNVHWSKTFIDLLKNTNDPRLGVVAELPPADNTTPGVSGDNNPAVQLGMPNGYDLGATSTNISNAPGYPGPNGSGDPVGNYSRPRNVILAKDGGPTFIQTYAEVELLLAEAKKRGWNVGTGTTADHYNKGVTAAMAQLVQFDGAAAIAPAAIAAYLTANPYVDANGFEMINTQYWAATILNDYESYANWRRSNFPTLTPVNYPGNATAGQIPRRLIYPQSEAAVNTQNYEASIARMGGNTYMTRVWWDQ